MHMYSKNEMFCFFFLNFLDIKAQLKIYINRCKLEFNRKNPNLDLLETEPSPHKNEITHFQQYSPSEPSCMERVVIVDYIESFSVVFIKV